MQYLTISYKKTLFEEAGLVILAALVGLSLSWSYARHISVSLDTTLSPVATAAAPTVLVQTNTWLASDGKYNLILSSVAAGANKKQYTVTVTKPDGGDSHIVLSALLTNTTQLSIPYNAWSPDDRFLFLEKHDGEEKDYLVVRADGEPIREGKQFLSVKDYFDSRNTGNTIHAVTGWASGTLLVITTEKEDKESTSYWLEIPSTALIPLATRF